MDNIRLCCALQVAFHPLNPCFLGEALRADERRRTASRSWSARSESCGRLMQPRRLPARILRRRRSTASSANDRGYRRRSRRLLGGAETPGCLRSWGPQPSTYLAFTIAERDPALASDRARQDRRDLASANAAVDGGRDGNLSKKCGAVGQRTRSPCSGLAAGGNQIGRPLRWLHSPITLAAICLRRGANLASVRQTQPEPPRITSPQPPRDPARTARPDRGSGSRRGPALAASAGSRSWRQSPSSPSAM